MGIFWHHDLCDGGILQWFIEYRQNLNQFQSPDIHCLAKKEALPGFN